MSLKSTVCAAALVLSTVLVVGKLKAAAVPEFKGKSPSEAAEALLAEGLKAAGNGSWERIAVGVVYYEGLEDKSRGQAILDQVVNGKPAWTDLQRTARFYAEIGDWAKAKPLYDRAISMRGKEAVLLAEAGAYYNLNGDRAGAEALFTRAFQAESDNPWAYAMAAASYLGKKPRPW